MKKLVLFSFITYLLGLLIFVNRTNAQTAPILTGFDNYNGTITTTPEGFGISWHSVSPASFYTSAGNFGNSSPSYKFGNDGDYITTKNMLAVDSITFWMKGNGGPFSTQNELRFYNSSDSMNWSLFTSIDSLPTTATNYLLPVNQLSGYFKIEYYKFPAGGNLAFDDLKINSNVVIGNNEIIIQDKITFYPSPTNGIVNMQLSKSSASPSVEIFDILGNKIQGVAVERKGNGLFTIDLEGKKNGFYFLKVFVNNRMYTKRVTLTN